MTLKNYRKLKNMTQVDLAAAAGVEQSQISKIENGAEARGRTWSRLIRYSGGAISLLDEYPEERP